MLLSIPTTCISLYLAAKYLQKTFAAFDGALGLTTDGESAFDLLCQGLDDLGAAAQSTSPSEESQGSA